MVANSGFVSGQTHAGHIHAAGSGPVAAAGVIDGRLHPELISDQEGITVFWISIMEPPDSDEMARNRFHAKIHKISMPVRADIEDVLPECEGRLCVQSGRGGGQAWTRASDA